MAERAHETESGETNDDLSAGTDRSCIACGYNLRGLGDEPRCPECGLLHIPAHFRQQVWDLVDSGKWFFSGMFTPFRKRLPGWWWALDRAGDLRRSFIVVARNVFVAAMILSFSCAVCDSVLVEVILNYSGFDSQGVRVEGVVQSYVTSAGNNVVRQSQYAENLALGALTFIESHRLIFEPSMRFLSIAAVMLVLTLIFWACPAFVGLCTQIRKGLPKFANAPRTIFAAANLESHRIVYIAIALAMWLFLELILRWRCNDQYGWLYEAGTMIACLAFIIYAAIGWIGPLRSDYTRQLIRSRWHAARIIVMYALAPLHMCWILVLAVVLHEWLDRIW